MQKQKEFSNEYYLATYNCETQNSSLLSEVSLPLYSSRLPSANEEKTRGLCQKGTERRHQCLNFWQPWWNGISRISFYSDGLSPMCDKRAAFLHNKRILEDWNLTHVKGFILLVTFNPILAEVYTLLQHQKYLINGEGKVLLLSPLVKNIFYVGSGISK